MSSSLTVLDLTKETPRSTFLIETTKGIVEVQTINPKRRVAFICCDYDNKGRTHQQIGIHNVGGMFLGGKILSIKKI